MARKKRKSQAKPPHLHRYRPGDRSDHSVRNAAICARRKEGATLQQIGDEHGLSRTAVSSVISQQELKAKQATRLIPLRKAFAQGVGPRAK